MNNGNLCYRCFFEKPIAGKACPKCGYVHTPNAVSPNCLLPGTVLKGRYLVGVALGVGGFGITYKCLDKQLGGVCAIKEYFPASFASRGSATKSISVSEQHLERYNRLMKRFVEESRLLRKLQHPNVISTYDSFFENNTAYYVMEYCDGIDLRRYTNNFTTKLPYDVGLNLLFQVMNGLEYVHSKGILHRDISPDNIYVTKNNSIKILDFGSARTEMDQYNRELSVIIKVGYAPIEQYGGRGKQGPYTDIYALGATFYHLFSTRMPMESTQRVAGDTLTPFSQLRPDLPDNLKYCIEKAMELTVAKRIANIAEMKRVLGLQNVSASPNRGGASAQAKQPAKVAGRDGNKTPVQKPVQPANAPQNKPQAHKAYNNPNIASISSRIYAYLIDCALWGAIYFGFMFGVLGLGGMAQSVISTFPLVLAIINSVLEMTSAKTIGKTLMRLRVCGTHGEPIQPGQVIVRNLIKLFGIFVLIFAEGEALLEDRATDSKVSIDE